MSSARLGDRTFGLTFAGLFWVIAGVVWMLSGRVSTVALATFGFSLAAGLFAPGLLMPLNRLWTLFGRRIGVVSNHVLLGVFFFFLITPMGAMVRLFRRTGFRKRPDSTVESYWTPVERKASAETYADMF
jgi:hypothetical protein